MVPHIAGNVFGNVQLLGFDTSNERFGEKRVIPSVPQWPLDKTAKLNPGPGV